MESLRGTIVVEGCSRSRKRIPLPRSVVVDVATVAERDHGDDENIVVDGVDNAVVPYTNSEPGSPLKRLGPWRPRILAKKRNRPTNAVTVLMINTLQSANCSRAQFDLVAQVQPKSAFT